MDAKEIMANEDVMEVTEGIARTGTGKGFKVTAGVGLAVLIGGVAYKFVVKPMVAKLKSKNGITVGCTEVNPVDYSEGAAEETESEEN